TRAGRALYGRHGPRLRRHDRTLEPLQRRWAAPRVSLLHAEAVPDVAPFLLHPPRREARPRARRGSQSKSSTRKADSERRVSRARSRQRCRLSHEEIASYARGLASWFRYRSTSRRNRFGAMDGARRKAATAVSAGTN